MGADGGLTFLGGNIPPDDTFNNDFLLLRANSLVETIDVKLFINDLVLFGRSSFLATAEDVFDAAVVLTVGSIPFIFN